MKKIKVIFLTLQVISQRDYERFRLDTIEKISELKVIDFTPLLQKKAFLEQLKRKRKGLSTILMDKKNKLPLLRGIFNESDLIISLLGQESELNHKILKMLKPYENKLCLMNISAFPLNPLNLKFFKFKKLCSKIFSEKQFFLINKIKKLSFKIKQIILGDIKLKPKYLFVCGEEVINNFSCFTNSNTKIIKSCSYDFVLSKKIEQNILDYKYFVFLDEYIVKHSDHKILRKNVEIEKIYYEELKNFFAFIESNLKIKVVIASHPRADLNYNKKKFIGYKVFQGNTSQLVRYAEGCLIHASTSVNFAVIYNKPMLFITTNRMQLTRYANELLASWFNKKPINISKKYNIEHINKNLKIELNFYREYLRKFISFTDQPELGFKSLIRSLEIKN